MNIFPENIDAGLDDLFWSFHTCEGKVGGLSVWNDLDVLIMVPHDRRTVTPRDRSCRPLFTGV